MFDAILAVLKTLGGGSAQPIMKGINTMVGFAALAPSLVYIATHHDVFQRLFSDPFLTITYGDATVIGLVAWFVLEINRRG